MIKEESLFKDLKRHLQTRALSSLSRPEEEKEEEWEAEEERSFSNDSRRDHTPSCVAKLVTPFVITD